MASISSARAQRVFWTSWAFRPSRWRIPIRRVWALGLLFPSIVFAQLPRPRLNAIDPIALARGSTQLITISGSELDEPETLRFSDPRIAAQRAGSNALGFNVTVPTNLPAGLQEVRFVGRFGVSNPRRFWVGTGPEVLQPSTNHSRDTAAHIALETGVSGRVEAGKRTWFRFPSPSTAGSEVRVFGLELDSRLEPDLALFDDAGKELARSRQGGRLRCPESQSGELVLSLNDLRFRGGEGFGYRLILVPIASSIDSSGGPFPVCNPLLNASRRDDIDSGKFQRSLTNSLLTVTVPAEIHGRFPSHGELVGVNFAAKKGEIFWLELVSERLGYPTDPLVLVQRVHPNHGEKGETQYVDVVELPKLDANIGGNEYPTGSRDVAGRFEAPEEAIYRVVVRDLFHRTSQVTQSEWQLSIRGETPGFSLLVVPTPLPRQKDDDRHIAAVATNLRRGETATVKVLAFRFDGFNGEIELRATPLPAGVTASQARILSGQRVGLLMLSASSEATNSVTSVTVMGRASVGTNLLTVTARAGTDLWSVADWDQERPPARLTDEFAVGVIGTETAPISIAPLTNRFEVVQGKKLAIPLRIERRDDFIAGFNLKPYGRPEFDKAKDLAIPEKATNTTVELNLADTALPVGTHLIWFDGRAPGKYRNQPEAVEVAKAALKTAEEAVVQAKPEKKEDAEKQKKAAVEQVKAFEERAKSKDIFVSVTSQPFEVRVLPAPE